MRPRIDRLDEDSGPNGLRLPCRKSQILHQRLANRVIAGAVRPGAGKAVEKPAVHGCGVVDRLLDAFAELSAIRSGWHAMPCPPSSDLPAGRLNATKVSRRSCSRS